jgi:negative regulator of sigma E activity
MTTDKIDNHYFQQLSALMDGDLPPDQARFLLRRMEHDTELTGCWERWQLCGDALRGRAQAPAPAGFADRVAAAVAAGSLHSSANAVSPRIRGSLARWGGVALAASVAAIALFMVRQQVPDDAPAQTAPALANQSPAAAASADPALRTAATVTEASVAVASVPRRQSDARRSATRNQQVARSAAALRSTPDRAVASAAAVPVVNTLASAAPTNVVHDPRDAFSNVQLNTPAVRPWPRAVLPQYSAGSGAFNADYSTDRAAQTFYPFEPRLPESPPVSVPENAPRDR